MKIKEMIVVEGKDDTAKVRLAVAADTIETNGSAISRPVLDQIRHAKEKRGVIVFTDPDYPGERIRHIINQAVPGCKHAFLTKDQARAKHPANRSLGIEHASVEDIRKALEDVYELAEFPESEITREDLLENRLIAGSGAADRRIRLGERLQIGQTNGKQLLKRLSQFQITREQFIEAVNKLDQEERNV